MIAMAISAAPIPIPAAAPVERPLVVVAAVVEDEGDEVEDVSEAKLPVPAVPVVEEDIVTDAVLEDLLTSAAWMLKPLTCWAYILEAAGKVVVVSNHDPLKVMYFMT